MKKYLFIFLSVVLVGAVIFLSLPQTSPFRKKPIYIAVAGPMNGDGQAMLKGIQLYLNMVNQKGGIDGSPVKLKIFDDKNDDKIASEIADKISEDKEILLVLGHKISATSIAAGRIYKKQGIPAITASATVDELTSDNEWYFRIVPTNSFQGAFTANYVFRTLNKKTVCLVHNKDVYGTTLAESFEKTAHDLGLVVKKKWAFNSEKDDVDNQLKQIAAELKAVENPGIIFVAAYPAHGVKLILSLKYSGMKCSFIGPDSFYGPSFIEEFKKNPQEQAEPGFYSDNIYAICPFLLDTANSNALEFHNKFKMTYNESPAWYAFGYYDAAAVAVEALKKSDLQGSGFIRRDRREIRNALANIYNPEVAVKGAMGDIFFDTNRNVKWPMSVGIYEKQMIFPAFSQYQMVPSIKPGIALEKVLNGQMIMVDQSLMNKANVVYTGIDINDISNIDIKTSTHVADFYIWFRYEGDIDVENIRFMNAVDPIKLGTPIAEEKTDDYTVKTYQVKAKFKNEFDFRRYPLDFQYLSIKFRHDTLTRDKLIYVKDRLGMAESLKKREGMGNFMNTGWQIGDMKVYQDIVTNSSTLGIPGFFNSPVKISYSQFNVGVKATRNAIQISLRNIFPGMVMLLCLYLIYFIPYRHIRLHLEIIMAVLVANAFYHYRLLSDLFSVKYGTFSEYFFFTIYLFITISVIFSILIFYLNRRGAETKIKWVMLMGKILYPCMIIAAGVGLFYKFFQN